MPLKTFVLTTDRDVTQEELYAFLDVIRDTWDLPLEGNRSQRDIDGNPNKYHWTIEIPNEPNLAADEFAQITATERIVTWLAFLRKNASPYASLSYQKENATICFDIKKSLIDWVLQNLEPVQNKRFNILVADIDYITSVNDALLNNTTPVVKRPPSPPLSLHFARMDVLPPTNNEQTTEKVTNNQSNTSKCTIM